MVQCGQVVSGVELGVLQTDLGSARLSAGVAGAGGLCPACRGGAVPGARHVLRSQSPGPLDSKGAALGPPRRAIKRLLPPGAAGLIASIRLLWSLAKKCPRARLLGTPCARRKESLGGRNQGSARRSRLERRRLLLRSKNLMNEPARSAALARPFAGQKSHENGRPAVAGLSWGVRNGLVSDPRALISHFL